MRLAKLCTMFGVGGSAYVGLELLYRGYSHISMFGAGGLCFLLMGRLRKKRLPAVVKAGAGAGMITAVELVTGLLVNRNYTVWDYRGQPGNFLGQICPMFTALWIPVSAAAMGLYGLTEKGLNRLAGGGASLFPGNAGNDGYGNYQILLNVFRKKCTNPENNQGEI